MMESGREFGGWIVNRKASVRRWIRFGAVRRNMGLTRVWAYFQAEHRIAK